MELQKFRYDNQLPKLFAVATIGWGAIGMLVGVLIAFQLAFPILNFGIEYTSFGRLRPVHTNAVIFAFVGNGILLLFITLCRDYSRHLCGAKPWVIFISGDGRLL